MLKTNAVSSRSKNDYSEEKVHKDGNIEEMARGYERFGIDECTIDTTWHLFATATHKPPGIFRKLRSVTPGCLFREKAARRKIPP